MRYNARNQLWESMQIKGVNGWFNDLRIDPDSIPSKFNIHELADGDSDGVPCRYANSILVNFFGTFITTGELRIEQDDRCGYNTPDEYSFGDKREIRFDELLKYEGVNDKLFSKIKINEELRFNEL